MSFELRDHTADVAVAAFGETRADVFAAVADGLAAASCDEIPDDGDRFSLSVGAETLEALLFDYLDELVYLRDVRAELPVANEVSIEERCDDWLLSGTARGVPFDLVDAREIKAVTYSDMRVASVEDGWEAYVVFDV